MIRHAKSDLSTELSDYLRPLNSKGLRDSRKIGEELQKLFETPDIIISSGAKRAFHTAELFSDQFKYNRLNIIKKDSLYNATSEELIKIIHQIDPQHKSAFIFGHNPGITTTTNILLNKLIEFKTACVAGIKANTKNWKDFLSGKCQMFIYLSPKDYYN